MPGIRTHLRAGVRTAAGIGLAVAAVALTSIFGSAATASPAEPLADVLVSASPAQNPVGPGAKFDLDIVAGNLGSATAEGVRITAALPAGVTFPDKSQAMWDCEASTATKIDCSTAAPLEPHGFAELSASLAVAHSYPYPRFAIPVKVSTPTRESNTQNNSARAVVQVSKRVVADVYATASANPQQVTRGGTFALKFGGGNKGNTAAAGIRFSAALPAGLELVNVPGGIYNCAASTATRLDCTLASDLDPGAYEFTTATVRVTDKFTERAARVPVSVSTSNRETERRNNTAVAAVRVLQP